jgi:hypothetical protein
MAAAATYQRDREQVAAEDFIAALGANYDRVELQECAIVGDVDVTRPLGLPLQDGRVVVKPMIVAMNCEFRSVNLSRARFRSVYFDGSRFDDVHLVDTAFEDAHFGGARFGDVAWFAGAVFGRADFEGATFRRTAYFESAVFGTAYFGGVHFHGGAHFESSRFEGLADFREAEFRERAWFSLARFEMPMLFDDVRYWPDTYWYALSRRWLNMDALWRRSPDGDDEPKWLTRLALPKRRPGGRPLPPTEFRLNSDHVYEMTNPLMKRHVADQQFVRAFRERHPFWSAVWRWTSDYGRSLGLWAFWSLLLVLCFGTVYSDLPCPAFLQGTYVGRVLGWLDPVMSVTSGTPENWFTGYYFSIVTFSTLGFGDVHAGNLAGQLWTSLEVVLGYVMLGGLISIFANKLARRS